MNSVPVVPPASGRAPTAAVVLANLGTPDAPTPQAVRRYLGEFLSDRRVVDLPRLFWLPLLHGLVLPLRAPKVAPKYASIWLEQGSPLAVYTRRLADAVGERLPGVRVVDAMRYGNPSLATVIGGLRAEGIGDIVVLPLYPQYSTTTTASMDDVVARAGGPGTRLAGDYHDDPAWVAAVADSIRGHREANGPAHLLFSFHGIPQKLVEAGDPYQRQCEASAAAIAAALGLAADEWDWSYQSRFGKAKWLEPSTSGTLQRLADRGVNRVDVVAPGFAADCLETLEEISMMLAEEFAARGGRLRYIPCLNDSPAHADVIAALARRQLRGR
ncbi:ferrochelatase [Lysobacter sp. GX 14042]|uniref:ferrochelatase n=1 Tax=Lysobacter sp. GX 14042 TaxID=2907155 RepID=UPI001F489986|nr:ferrochelatase [Lysobacter sp. GX 14042]MCE7032411.1 ferrochelatase [Lysobacter sp. GX 14042]